MKENQKHTDLVEEFCEANGIQRFNVSLDNYDFAARFLSYAIEQKKVILTQDLVDWINNNGFPTSEFEMALYNKFVQGIELKGTEQPKTDKLTLQECILIAESRDGELKYPHIAILDYAKKIYAAQFKQPEPEKWISVKHRLPDYQKEVLICVLGKVTGKPFYKVDMYTIDKGWRLTSGEVTHWQPLPPATNETNTMPEAPSDDDVRLGLSEILESLNVSSNFDTKENSFGGGWWAAYRWMRDKMKGGK